jgi:molybdate transport system ATP-binding protein
VSRIHVDVRKRLAGITLDARLDVGSEIVVLFGPSGAGKSSVLNAIAGLLEPDEGVITIDGGVVFSRGAGRAAVWLPPRARRVGYVLQDYALFPHLSALENVAYPLRRRRDRLDRARALLASLELGHLADCMPAQLSGGQQQRVALARALALDSRVLLLDEPFAALEAGMRERLIADLRRLQQERGLAVIVVTHDLDDAFAVGDTLAVMRDGRVEQVGPVADVFAAPATNGVADVIGIRNLIRGRVVENTPVLVLDWSGTRLELDAADPDRTVGSVVTAYVRPEDVKILYPDRPVARAMSRNVMRATVVSTRAGAAHRVLQVRAENGAPLEVRFPLLSYATLPLLPGDDVMIALRRAGIRVLND